MLVISSYKCLHHMAYTQRRAKEDERKRLAAVLLLMYKRDDVFLGRKVDQLRYRRFGIFYHFSTPL